MAIDLSQFHQVFFEESIDGLDIMESSLMELDIASVDSEVINAIFRAAHSIKGGSATFDFTAICDFTHVLETLLDQVRSGSRDLKHEHVDLLLQSVDSMRDMLARAQANDLDKPQSAIELQTQFENILAGKESEAAPAVTGAAGESVAVSVETVSEAVVGTSVETTVKTSAEDAQPSQTSSKDEHWQVSFRPHATMLQNGNDAYRIISALAELDKSEEFSVCADVAALPDLDNLDPEKSYLGWSITLAAGVAVASINEAFEWVDDEADISIEKVSKAHNVADNQASSGVPATAEPIEAEPSHIKAELESPVGQTQAPTVQSSQMPSQGAPVAAAKPAKKAEQKTAETTFIRVGIDKIDELINMVGELVITQSMLSQLSSDVDVAKVPRLPEGIGQLEQNTRELQESVMRIRMLPISFSFNRFPRLVRDLSQKLNKKIKLEINGENTELDKTVMEKIGDPLVHLVRNAIDHGIESPQTRTQAGKSEAGTITLDAFHQGGHIVIQIKDDGAGLNREKVLNKALEKNLVTQQVASQMSDKDVYDLIFQPGFSTAAAVTDVSGRGVGMDVVKRNIQALSGSVEIASKLGQGSTITIRLPLTLAILDGQLIRVGSNIYIFPLVSIVESMQCSEKFVNTLAGGQKIFKLRDEYVPIIELSETFNIESDYSDIDGSLMVVVESQGQKVGVIVDELLAQQQVVIKSLEQNYKQVDGVSGATILGDGMVALILDVQNIVSLFSQQKLIMQQLSGQGTSAFLQRAANTLN